MEKGWSDPEHVGKVTINTLDTLSEYFMVESKKGEEKDMNLIIKLSQAMGYQSQIYAGISKTFDMAKRLESVEKLLEHADPELLAMGLNPVIVHTEDGRSKFA